MNGPSYPAWIENAPEPKRTIRKIRFETHWRDDHIQLCRHEYARHGWAASEIKAARAANHRILKLRRQLREMRGEQ